MKPTHVFAGIPVRNLATAADWYERLFGRPPDMRPAEHEVVWRLTDTGLVYVVVDPARAGHGLITLIVDDLDPLLAALEQRAIAAEAMEHLDTARKVTVIDPDGNRIALGELTPGG